MSVERRILLTSALGLFLELAWIRFLGSEIRIFAYFHNLLLLVCFLGLAFGLARAARPVRAGRETRPVPLGLTLALSALLVLVLVPDTALSVFSVRKITAYLGSDPTYHTWGERVHREGAVAVLRFLAGLGMLVGIVVALVGILAPIGELLGRLLRRAPDAVSAYSWDIAGSLLGVLAFTGLSFLALPPGVWFGVALAPLGLVWALGLDQEGGPTGRVSASRAALALASVLVVVLLSNRVRTSESETEVVWSPYQRLSFVPQQYQDATGKAVETGFIVRTNHTDYMRVGNYGEAFVAAHPEFFAPPGDRPYDNYNLPYRFHPAPEDVLIVGAGAGNDVAGALRNGARRIDAVEIDPEILRFGMRHPEAPYGADHADRVTVHVDDARSFFRKTERRYDLIVFGTLDSHTLSSSLCNVRLDNFVYTVDSFREARALLKPGGVVVLAFAVNDPFLGVRIRRGLEEAFGTAPVTLTQQSKIVFWVEYFVTGSRETIDARLRDDPTLARIYAEKRRDWPGDAGISTDDWPYLYLAKRRLPTVHLVTFAILAVLAGLLLRGEIATPGALSSSSLLFAALGAGFMLLEVQGVTRIALLFGATWVNNAIVIAGILLAVLGANAVVRRYRPARLGPVFAGIAASLLLAYAFPAQALNGLTLAPRLAAATALTASPVLLAGVVFAVSFERARDRSLAFAANLLGAVAGGMCESLSFLLGLRALSLVALGFYAIAWLAARRGREGDGLLHAGRA